MVGTSSGWSRSEERPSKSIVATDGMVADLVGASTMRYPFRLGARAASEGVRCRWMPPTLAALDLPEISANADAYYV